MHSKDIIGQADYKLSDAEEAKFYNLVNSGALTNDRKSAFLREIAPPIYIKGSSPEKVFQNLNSKQELRILSTLSGHGFDGVKELEPNDLKVALAETPTPIEFETFEQAFMENIRDHNPPDELRKYETSMANFKQKLFGKRLEYYGAIERIEHKAHQKQRETTARDRVLNAYNQNSPASNYPKEDLGYLSPEMQAVYQVPSNSISQANYVQQPNQFMPDSTRNLLGKIRFHNLSRAESQKYLEQGRVDGDQYIFQGKSYELTADALAKLGLEPKYSLSLPGANIALSSIYNNDGRNAVTAYVNTKEGTKICTYYHSKSQGNWRYLPDYTPSKNPNNPDASYYGKGYSEESLTLPSETQFVLDLIAKNEPPKNLDPVAASFAFLGTAKRYPDLETYSRTYERGQLRGDYYQEVSRQPAFDFQTSNTKTPPHALNITGSFAPSFVYPKATYQTNTSFYGNINVEHFDSADGQLRYTFNRDQNNHAWLSNIEVNSPINSLGLHAKWVNPGDFSTPPYEYPQQAGNYGDQPSGNYVNMWNNYLKRMPIIQKYLESLEHARQYR